MSNVIEEEDTELEDLKKQIEQVAEENKEKAAEEAEASEPSPEPVSPPAPELTKEEPAVAPKAPEVEKTQDDPLEWAKKKGLQTPEDMARALRQKEIEFHERNQKGHPGYKDIAPSPNWAPTPQGYGYPPPYYFQPPVDPHNQLGQKYGLDPEDVKKVMPMIVDAAETIYASRNAIVEKKLRDIETESERSNELMQLMQDPAFTDARVQKEIHAILDSDPAIFQRERRPRAYAFEKALGNLARKTLQQGTSEGSRGPTPPVTAGGGNGSAYTVPKKITTQDFDSWTPEEQKAFLNSNGRKTPKR